MENKTIRTWNRCATYFNILNDISKEEGIRYASQFNSEELDEMYKVFAIIKEVGYDKTKSMIFRGEMVIQ